MKTDAEAPRWARNKAEAAARQISDTKRRGRAFRSKSAAASSPTSRRLDTVVELNMALAELEAAIAEASTADVSNDARLKQALESPLSRVNLARRFLDSALRRFGWKPDEPSG